VLKPLDQEQGRGATAAIKNFMELLAAFHSAKEHTRSHLLLQNHIEGHDYRLNMSRGRLQFVIKRSVPVLVGNGCDTVQDLLDAFNADRRSQGLIDGISKQINANDSDLLTRIKKAGLLFSSVLEAGRSIRLRGSANASNGGIYEDLDPACVHPRIRRQCEAIAQTFRLDVCGIDYISPDISMDPNACPGAFIEVNSMPQNSPKRVPALLNNLFHSDTSAHVPCLVLMAGWQVERCSYWGPHLDAILAKHPRSVVAIPRELESLILPIFPSELSDLIHIFSHPREPLLDKSVQSVIYLVTPQLVMMKGLPGAIHPVLVSLDSSQALSPKIVWSPFLRQHCAIAQTVSPPA
jgi:cyanophycin synthetase